MKRDKLTAGDWVIVATIVLFLSAVIFELTNSGPVEAEQLTGMDEYRSIYLSETSAPGYYVQ